MSDAPREDRRTIILRVDSGSSTGGIIELAIAMAESLHSTVHGLFVESQDLLRAAGLPFSREISFTTAREHRTSREQMQRSQQYLAAQFRESLERAAQASRIPWRFDYISEKTSEPESRPATVTYTIVGHRVTTRSRPARFKPLRRIILVENGLPQLVHALEVVFRRFRDERVELTLVTDREPGGEPNPRLQACLESASKPVSLIELPRRQLESRLVEFGKCYDCAIVPARQNPAELGLIGQYLRGPLIMVAE